jgi:putative ABC transport system ATP-binding protein
MTALLDIDTITVRYRKRQALRQVSVSARAGSLVAITGASGAGKTTLLWAVAGLVPVSDGTVSIQGRPVTRRKAAGEPTVLIPQGNGLASVLTARENVLIALLAAGFSAPDAAERAQRYLELLGIGGQADQLAEELSGGQRQRVAIARGLALGGPLLLADEITSDLDSANRDLALGLLRQEAQRGALVLLATHDPEAAAGCDARWHLVDGQVAPVPG